MNVGDIVYYRFSNGVVDRFIVADVSKDLRRRCLVLHLKNAKNETIAISEKTFRENRSCEKEYKQFAYKEFILSINSYKKEQANIRKKFLELTNGF